MSNLPLTLSCWDYDRTRALADGSVRPDGIDLTVLSLGPEETFFRMARYREFDASELSLSSYTISLGRDDPPFIAIPVFPSRSFRHSSIYISTKSGIREPRDIIGKRVGVPEYQMTAPVWIRGMLAEDYGIDPMGFEYFTGGQDEPGREEKLKLDFSPSIRTRPIGPGKTLSQMLVDGEIDCMHTARAPSTFATRPDAVQRLFPNYVEVERDYYRRTRIFPIMHIVAIRRELYRAHPWVAQSLAKAFAEAKAKVIAGYTQTAALKAMLPWLTAHVEEAQREMGEDWWPYGLEPNYHVLDTLLRYHHEQGLSKRRFAPEELFAPETLDSFKI
ncbi:MAG: ABC transporter substrate-binding protein [Betaproteobacteria bacterium]|nr:ABC transporter substrate-binding protein [Betaproteobacteria bacterium]